MSQFGLELSQKETKNKKLQKRADALKENMRRRKERQKELSKNDSPERKKSD